MNFFKSVFSDDPDPQAESGSGSTISDPNPPPSEPSPSSAAASSAAGAWNFGGLIKTLTSKSESIIETYRRDLQEFGTGLKKEIEVAQGSLDEFGNTVAKGTAQIISKGKDAILAVDLESDSDHNRNSVESGNRNSSSGYYSRFDAAVRAVQGDASTYCDEPEDLEEYEKWKSGFSIDGKSEEMEKLLKENEAMEGVYKSVVPNSVDHESFWFRYYYKVYRIKKAEDFRARLVKGMEKEDDEDLSWDVEEEEDDDDDDDSDGGGVGGGNDGDGNGVVGGENVGKRVDTELRVGGTGKGNEEGTKKLNVEEGLKVEKRDSLLESKELVEELEGVGGSKEIEGASVDEMSKLVVDNAVSKNADSAMESGEKEITETEAENAVSKNDSAVESDEKVIKERKGDDVKSSVVNVDKEEDEEEDLEWDEIEDLSSIDEKKATQSGSTSTSKADLRKRLSAAEEEEDLSWDIEEDDDDDDEKPAKS